MSDGTKYDVGKPRMDLIPPRTLEVIAAVFAFGAEKYGDYNWYKGIKYSRIFAAIMRHLWAYWRGEDLDPESGLSHLAHAGCGIFMLTEFIILGRVDLDDRNIEKNKQKIKVINGPDGHNGLGK